MRPVVALYVTHPDGTGDVERGLGLHARLRGVHLGADGDSAAGEICAEIHAEGPAEEKELFQKSDTGVLVFNTFGRRLAELCFERHGRRFATYRKRSDAGKRQPPERLRGTMKGVSIAQKAAAHAAGSVVLGGGRPGGRPVQEFPHPGVVPHARRPCVQFARLGAGAFG